MSFGSRLKEKREELGLKQSELGRLLGITGSAIGNYENGVSSPKADILYRVFDVLKCDANYLFQDEMKELENNNFTTSEIKMINKYRTISNKNPLGKEIVDFVLEKEYERCQVIDLNQIKEDEAEYNVFPISVYEDRASAGFGNEFLAESCRTIKVIGNRSTIRADFALPVRGRSMEPLYYDGDIVLVHQQPAVDVGEIGIYSVDNKAFIKKQGEYGLISVNEDYDDIELTEYQECKCFGKVIGKLEDDWIVEK